MLKKQEARRLIKEKRKKINRNWRVKASVELCERAACWLAERDFKKVSLFLGYDGEPLTDFLAAYCLATGKEVYVPVTDYRRKILFHARLYDLARTVRDAYGIRIPEGFEKLLAPQDLNVEVVFCPGLAFDVKGARVGHGEGFYDRFLADLKDAIRIGLAFEFQVFEELEAESNDVRMDFIFTEKRLIEI